MKYENLDRTRWVRGATLTEREIGEVGGTAESSAIDFDRERAVRRRDGWRSQPADPATSVLDPDCRVHGVPNLYVVDGSFMPTSGGAAPTLTIFANAFRTADKILERARRGELG